MPDNRKPFGYHGCWVEPVVLEEPLFCWIHGATAQTHAIGRRSQYRRYVWRVLDPAGNSRMTVGSKARACWWVDQLADIATPLLLRPHTATRTGWTTLRP